MAQLCATCHDASTAVMVEKHRGFALGAADCLSCHDPHVSQRSGLLNPVAHAPFEDGDCESCHAMTEGPGVRSARALTAPTAELCQQCHVPSEMLGEPKFVHAPAAQGECVACHVPHASRERHLVAKPGAESCFACHGDEREQLARASVHAPVRDGSCGQCHAPHASNAKGLLEQAAPELCFACHEAEKDLLSEASVHAPFVARILPAGGGRSRRDRPEGRSAPRSGDVRDLHREEVHGQADRRRDDPPRRSGDPESAGRGDGLRPGLPPVPERRLRGGLHDARSLPGGEGALRSRGLAQGEEELQKRLVDILAEKTASVVFDRVLRFVR